MCTVAITDGQNSWDFWFVSCTTKLSDSQISYPMRFNTFSFLSKFLLPFHLFRRLQSERALMSVLRLSSFTDANGENENKLLQTEKKTEKVHFDAIRTVLHSF